MQLDRRSIALGGFFLASLAILGGCGGGALRRSAPAVPRLVTQRLGNIRCAMTYDGDWLGGIPSIEDLEGDLDLAARRGVEILIDLRWDGSKQYLPLEPYTSPLGLELVEVGVGRPVDTGSFRISKEAVDQVRSILTAPGRRRVLLLDDSGTLAPAIYAVHLAVDEGIPEAEALRAARAVGLSSTCEGFVREQVDRIESQAQ